MTKIPNSDKLSSTRSENSLLCLTKKFLKMIRKSDKNIIDLNMAASALGVHKRRVYDMTNVLEGLGLLSKWSVNNAKWIGKNIDYHIGVDSDEKENVESANSISNEEQELNQKIGELNNEIAKISQDESNITNAYITFKDLQSIPSLSNKLIFSIRAPPETVMETPRLVMGQYTLSLTSETGKILVYYVSEDN